MNLKTSLKTLLCAALLLSCATYQPILGPSPTDSHGLAQPGPTRTPFLAVQDPQGDPSAPYQILSPTAILVGDVTIEVKEFSLAGQALHVGIQARGPVLVLDNPERPIQPILKAIQVLAGPQETPLDLQPAGSSGGSSDDGVGGMVVEEAQSFVLNAPLPSESRQPIIVLVTFHEGFGIPGPVRFTLQE